MSASARVVTKPDAEILNLFRFLLTDLCDGEDFTTGLFGLTDFLHEVPELCTGHDGSATLSIDTKHDKKKIRPIHNIVLL